MGVISNVINTKFTTSGADKVVADTGKISRNQTRLGQASASAGRSFAAQSQGLGGLVAAYAGAAATSFALEAAFTALSKAARFEQTLNGLNALAATAGESGSTVLKTVKEITKNQLTMAEAAAQANLSLSAGFNLDQITGLSNVALRASRALGRDLSDAMDRVVKGSAKMEAELLDELGIYTKIGPATRAYAAALGVSVGSLTEYQRRQAFANAVIAEGTRKFSMISTSIPTAAETLSAFGAHILDIATKIGGVLANVIAPLAAFLTNNLAGSFAVVGIAISLLASKSMVELSRGFDLISAKAEKTANTIRDKILSMSKSATEANKAAVASIGGLDTKAGLSREDSKTYAAIRQAAESGSLSTAQLSQATTLLNTRLTALQATVSKDKEKLKELEAEYAIAKKATSDFTKATKEEISALETLSKKIDTVSKKLQRYDAHIANTSKTLKTINTVNESVAAKIGKGLGSIVTGTTAGFTSLGHALSKTVSLVSGITLWGSIIMGATTGIAALVGKQEEYNALLNKAYSLIQKVFEPSTWTKTNTAITSIVGNTLDSMAKTDAELKNLDSFTFEQKVLGVTVEITKTKEELVKEVSDILTNASEGITFGDALTKQSTWTNSWITAGGAIAGGLISALFTGGTMTLAGVTMGAAAGAALDAHLQTSKALKELSGSDRAAVEQQYGAEIFSGEQGAIIARALQQLKEARGEYETLSFIANKYYNTQKEIIIAIGGQISSFNQLQEVATKLGSTVADIKKKYDVTVNSINDTVLTPKLALPNSADIRINIINEKELLENIKNTIQGIRDKINEGATLSPGEPIPTGFIDRFKSIFSDSDMNAAQAAVEKLPGARDKLTRALANQAEAQKKLNNLDKSNTAAIATATSELSRFTLHVNTATYEIDNYEKAIAKVYKNPEASNSLNNIDSSLTSLSSSTQSANNDFLLLANSIATVSDMTSSGGATLESLSQANTTQLSVLRRGYSEVSAAESELIKLQKARKDFEDNTNTKEFESELAALDNEIANAEKRVKAARDTATAAGIAYNQERKNLEIVIKELEVQKQLTSEYKSYSTARTSDLTTIANGKLITTEAEKQLALFSNITNVIEGRKDAMNAVISQQNALANSALTKDLTTEQRSSLNALTKEAAATDGAIAAILGNNDPTTIQTIQSLITVTNAQRDAAETGFQALVDYNNMIIDIASTAITELNKAKTTLDSATEDIKSDIEELNKKQLVLQIQYEIDKTSIQNQIALAKQQFAVDSIQAEIGLVEAKVSSKAISKTEGAIQENALQQSLLTEKEKLINLEYTQAKEAIADKSRLLIQEHKNRLSSIDEEAKTLIAKYKDEMALIAKWSEARDAALKDQSALADKINTANLDTANSMARVLYNAIVNGANVLAQANNIDPSSLQIEAFIPIDTKPLSAAIDSTLTQVITDASKSSEVYAATVEEQRVAKVAAENADFANSISNIMGEAALNRITHENKLGALRTERATEDENAKARLANADKEKEKLTELQERLVALFDALKNHISSAIVNLNNLVFYGEGTFSEIVGNMFKSIQQDFFKITIADPLSNMLSTSIFDWAGVSMKKGADNASVIPSAKGDALLVSLADPLNTLKPVVNTDTTIEGVDPKNPLGNFISNIISGIKGFFTNLFGEGGFVSNLFKNLFGQGGILSSLLSGLGSFISSIFFASGGTIRAFAGGGIIQQFASGGSPMIQNLAGGGHLRDRVPAMLEPGEFVIRRPAARAIGGPALQSMNATGRVDGSAMSAPIINVSNEGSAKEVKSAQPKFDGEKYVIDIVLRDLANNGPLRRTLRGGKA